MFTKDGKLTAGNSSQISDGAAALVLASEKAVQEHGLRPLAKIIGSAWAGVESWRFVEGPIPAIRKLLQKTGLGMDDFDLVENNEAFSLNNVLLRRELGIPYERINIYGGAIALGHPIGASGARIVGTLVNALRTEGKRRGLASLVPWDWWGDGGGGGDRRVVYFPQEDMMRFFTTEGPVNCADHYCLPPLARLDLDDVMALIAQKKYFLLHAPRQTGKTSCLLALAGHLNRGSDYPRRLRQHRDGAGRTRKRGNGHGRCGLEDCAGRITTVGRRNCATPGAGGARDDAGHRPGRDLPGTLL